MQLRGWTLAAAAVLFVSAPAEAQQPTAQEIVDRYVEVIGGRERIEAVQSRTLSYEINAGGMTIPMEVRQRRPNLAMSTLTTPGGDVVSGFDGERVYVVTPIGSQVMDGPEADEVRAGSAFDADITFAGYGSMEVTGREEHGGRPCWAIRMTVEGGSEARRCFDVETGLQVAVTQLQDGAEVTALIEEYREFDGIHYPSRTRAEALGQTVVTTLLEVRHVDVPAEVFAAPAGLR